MTADNYHNTDGLLSNKLGITDKRALREYDFTLGQINAIPALQYAERQDKLSRPHYATFMQFFSLNSTIGLVNHAAFHFTKARPNLPTLTK